MQQFLERHKDRIVGVLSGFDRILFRGTLRSICYSAGFEAFLASHRVLLKNFVPFAQAIFTRIKDHARRFAEEQGRPFHYLPSSSLSKEAYAREIMLQDKIRQGLICVFSCVEPCQTFTVRRNRETKRLQLVSFQGKCLHLYFYFVDREFGLMHVRLQTWLPLSTQVCLNGQEYLAHRLDRAGVGYEKRDNCFAWIEDLPRAQRMMDDLLKRNWARFLNRLARRVNPWMDRHNRPDLHGYYWTLRESEYATDVIFRDEAALEEIYPALVNHAIGQFDCQDVMRFLGRRTNARFSGEAGSNMKQRTEGVSVKHRVEENSIKMYDKQGVVLRIETTINNPR